MSDRITSLARAVGLGLGTGLVAGGLALTPNTVFAEDEEERAAELERFQVTGTRIRRPDIEGALPVTVIDRETIELSGKTSIADLLRTTPFNSAGSFRPQSGTTAQAAALLSLRALGPGRTLILIDGRRLPVAPNVGEGQDLNAVPLAVVERIEILSDGASAIYGSDAIGGVVNIITRKDFTGVELNAGFSRPDLAGGDTEEGSILFGAASERGRVVAGVGYNSRDIVFAREREWSRGGFSIFSNNFFRTNFIPLMHPQFGAANVPGCQGEGFSIVGPWCAYDFTLVSADEAAVRNEALFVRSDYNVNNDWTLYGNFSVSRVNSFGRYAPVPSAPWLVGGFGAPVLTPGLPNHPATPPEQGGLNPNWQAYQDFADELLLLTHRFAANGPRDTHSDGNVYDADVGLHGRVGTHDVEFGVRRSDSQYHEIGRNYVISALAQPLIDSGAYNIYDPFGVPRSIRESFTVTINRDSRTLEKEIYAMVRGDWFDLIADPIGFVVGVEYRETDYRDLYDSLREAGQVTGSAGNSSFGSRHARSVFAEILLPLANRLELSAALRHDDYSDFGTALSPKLALRWQPLDELTLRASWGQGFRAPPLFVLAQQPASTLGSVIDPPTAEDFGVPPDTPVTVFGFVVGNRDIEAEDSDSYSIGLAAQPFDWLNGSIDFWRTKINDRVAFLNMQLVVDCLSGRRLDCPPGLSNFPPTADPLDPNLGPGAARDPDTGALRFVNIGWGSLGTIITDGVDVNLRSNWSVGPGVLRSDFQATYTRRHIVDSGENVVGLAGFPDWRGNLANSYSVGDFSLAWNIQHIDGQKTAVSQDLDSLPSWTIHDAQINWHAPWNGRVTLGIDNVANKKPVLDPGAFRGFNFNLYNAYGRIWYLRYRQIW